MKCRALEDGLLGKTSYIHAGEVFEEKECPSWAEPVKKKAGGTDAPSAAGRPEGGTDTSSAGDSGKESE